MSDISTRKGKLARLPKSLRDQVNAKLADNQPASVILPWLNELPEVKAILERDFAGEPINDQNLSAWRMGGFAEWMKNQYDIERTQSKSRHALELVKAGGHNITDGMAAILAGDLLEEWEIVDDENKDALMDRFLRLRAADHVKQSIELQKKKLRLEEDKHGLNVKRFRVTTVKKFMQWAQEPRAVAILTSDKPKEVQMDLLHELLWGAKPDTEEAGTDGLES